MRLRPPARTPSWPWPIALCVVTAMALLTLWASDRTGTVTGMSCTTRGSNEPVCEELRARGSTVLFGGMGLMVITTLGYSAVVVRRYGSDHDDV